MATADVFDAFLSDAADAALMHGPTYMASPLACAAANASLDLFDTEPRLQQVAAIEAQLKHEQTVLKLANAVMRLTIFSLAPVRKALTIYWGPEHRNATISFVRLPTSILVV